MGRNPVPSYLARAGDRTPFTPHYSNREVAAAESRRSLRDGLGIPHRGVTGERRGALIPASHTTNRVDADGHDPRRS